MNNLDSGITNEVMSRRGFLVKSMAFVGGAALLASGVTVPQMAYAASPALADGTYTVTANVYIDKQYTPIGANAYLTRVGNPPLNKPVKPVSNNATLTVSNNGATKKLVVPIVNESFGLISAPESMVNNGAKIDSYLLEDWSPGVEPNAHVGVPQRVTSITFDVSNFSGGQSIAVFSPCKEYASFLIHRGYKDWPICLTMEFPQ